MPIATLATAQETAALLKLSAIPINTTPPMSFAQWPNIFTEFVV
jgi:hypothetical protein|tara:strand:- start:2362 stop:2493 length:132 start_codon:yes stop_codon:yes gene_type:complete